MWAFHKLNHSPIMQHAFMLIALVFFGDSASAVEGIPLSDGEEESRFDYDDPGIAFERCGSGSVSNCWALCHCNAFRICKIPIGIFGENTPVREW